MLEQSNIRSITNKRRERQSVLGMPQEMDSRLKRKCVGRAGDQGTRELLPVRLEFAHQYDCIYLN